MAIFYIATGKKFQSNGKSTPSGFFFVISGFLFLSNGKICSYQYKKIAIVQRKYFAIIEKEA